MANTKDRSEVKILIIDDTPENLYVFQEMLQNAGFNVLSAKDGSSGLNLAKSELPDIIICDIMMPDIDGYEVMKKLREQPDTEAIPFIFLTAKVEMKDIREGMLSGADDYITKPVTATELIRAVEARLGKRDIYEKRIKDLSHSISYALPHELQTPLTAILGFTQFLKDNYDSVKKKDILEISTSIAESATRLNELIEKIMLLSRLDLLMKDNESIRLLRSSTAMVTEKIFKDVIKRKNDKFGVASPAVDISIENCDVKVNADNLKKILDELIDNAFKFSEKNASVEIRAFTDESNYIIAITDYGRGMTKEQVASIGNYMQFDRALNEKIGTGLGLSIAKRIIELHNGALSIKSFPGKGTTFIVSLGRAMQN